MQKLVRYGLRMTDGPTLARKLVALHSGGRSRCTYPLSARLVSSDSRANCQLRRRAELINSVQIGVVKNELAVP
jgi:hypothetical protein